MQYIFNPFCNDDRHFTEVINLVSFWLDLVDCSGMHFTACQFFYVFKRIFISSSLTNYCNYFI